MSKTFEAFLISVICVGIITLFFVALTSIAGADSSRCMTRCHTHPNGDVTCTTVCR
jgi:hypothetical protein